MKNYVQLGNNLIGRGPYLHKGVTLHGFALQGDRKKLQALLDRMFDKPSGGEVSYWAITGKVFVSFARINAVSSKPDAHHGSIPEIDVSFWVLALRKKLSMSILRWIPVYLFVDSAAAMAAGREVYGFPKQLGEFTIPTGAPSMTRFSTETVVIPRFHEHAIAEKRTVLEIEPIEPVPTSASEAMWEDEPTSERGFFAEFLPEVEAGSYANLELAGMGLKSKVTMAFLKQFPDVSDTTLACYQAIAEASATVENSRGGGLTPGRFRARVHSYASHPFEDELGIDGNWHDVGRALWLDYDFLMHMGVVQWKA